MSGGALFKGTHKHVKTQGAGFLNFSKIFKNYNTRVFYIIGFSNEKRDPTE